MTERVKFSFSPSCPSDSDIGKVNQRRAIILACTVSVRGAAVRANGEVHFLRSV